MNSTHIRRLAILFTVFALLTSAGNLFAKRARVAADDSEEQGKSAAIKCDEDLNDALRNKDRAALERILADNLSWVARGDRLDKAQVIADVMSENLHFKALTHDGVMVKMFGNTAVMTGHSTSVLEYKGKMFTAPRLFTSVYMNLNGQWQLVAHQVTDLDKPKSN